MVILWKGCKPDNFESRKSLMLSFMNIRSVRSNLLIVNISLNQTLLTFLLYMWDKSGWLNWFWEFLCERLFSFNPKEFYYSCVWSCSLCEGRTSFCMGLTSRIICWFFLRFCTGFTSLNDLPPFPLSISFFVFMDSFWLYFI